MEHLHDTPLRAVAEAVGAAVGVTDHELLIARARWFGGGGVRRFRLREVSAVVIHPPAGVRRLHVVANGRLLVLVYGPKAAAAFDALTALIRRPAGSGRRVRAAVVATAARADRRANGGIRS